MKREEQNKFTLYTIIVLLSIFSIFAILGTIKHIIRDVNIHKQFKFNNHLYFYSDGKLLGKYECKTSKCDYATYENGLKPGIISDKYAFISDKNVILYNIVDSKVELNLEGVKKYNNVYAVKKDNLWGAYLINSNLTKMVDFKYNDLEYINNKLVVLDKNAYKIINGDKTEYTTNNKIVNFNDQYIILAIGENQILSDYSGKRYFENISNKTIDFVDKYFLIKRQSEYYLYNLVNNNGTASYVILGNFTYTGEGQVSYYINGNVIEFYDNTNLLKSIELPAS